MNNVLFLAMSTFPYEYKANTFKVSDRDYVIADCIGQMEPVAKYMILENGDCPLHMVVLCTPETEKISENGDFKGESPIGFFENQIEEFRKENDLPAPLFHRIQLGLDNPYTGIAEAVNTIRTLKREEPGGCLWIDPHGAFRDVALIMQAIVSLLKVDGIVPDEVMGVRYGNKEDGNMIVPQKEAFGVFDFVTGMNDFINFGNADVLKTYFANGDENEQKIVGAIDKIAQGTQLCYPVLYRQGLNELAGLLSSVDPGNDTILGLFRDYIEDSYGSLLKGKTRTILGIVRHCYEKKLYQQALTFIESDMPREIIAKDILTFGEANYQNEAILKDAKKVDIKHYVFDTFVTLGGLLYVNERSNKDDHVKAMKLFSEHKKFYLDALGKRNFDQSPILYYINTEANNNKIPFDIDPSRKTYKICRIGTQYSSEYYGIIGVFLRMHRALKGARNLFNHADSDVRDIKAILDTMELYIMYAEFLYENK